MAELLTLARPYAKAAFAYASEQGATDNWSNALQVLSATAVSYTHLTLPTICSV